jgi:DNA-binding transcriptional LysR family regulator
LVRWLHPSGEYAKPTQPSASIEENGDDTGATAVFRIKHAVAAGLGLAVLSRHALADDPARDGVAVLPVAGFPIERRWLLVWRRDRRLSLAAQRFIEHVQAHPPDEAPTPAGGTGAG